MKYFNRISRYLGYAVLMVLPLISLAAPSAGSGVQIDVSLDNLIDLINSKVVGGIAVLSIMAIGFYGLHQGHIDKKYAISTIACISIIIGASHIASYLGLI